MAMKIPGKVGYRVLVEVSSDAGIGRRRPPSSRGFVGTGGSRSRGGELEGAAAEEGRAEA